MTLPSPHAIIFDWDNTLVDTWPVIHQALTETFKYMGHTPWSFETTKNNVRQSMRDSFPGLFGDRWEEAAKIYQQCYVQYHLDRLNPLRGAQDMLVFLLEMRMPVYVVSNKKGPTLRKEISHIGWDDFFKRAVGSNDADKDKPHIDPVLLAFEKTALKPNEHVWFIGDSDIDLECAENCGCTPILYGEEAKDHVAYTLTHFHNVPFAHHVYDHVQLLDLFKQYVREPLDLPRVS